ncbi:hypothetical protein V6N13_079642 [Hibiscus sabdariffa]
MLGIAAGKAQKSRSICKSHDQMILSGLFHTKKFSCDLSIETGLPSSPDTYEMNMQCNGSFLRYHFATVIFSVA